MSYVDVSDSVVYVGQYAETGDMTLVATTTGYTRADGSFVDDGFVVGMTITPTGFAANTVTTVTAVAALTLTTSARAAEAGAAGRALFGAGPFALIENMTSWEGTHGEENSTTTYVFGREAPIERAGRDTDEYRLSGLYDIADTDGQNVLRDSKDNRTWFNLRVYPGGTGAKAYQQPCRTTQYTDSGDAGGDYVQCSFAAKGVGTRVYSDASGTFA
jgi:hypothetical protein